MPPSVGTAMMVDTHTIQWKMDQLGVSGNEGATLEFIIQHTADTSGLKKVNQSITYSDNEGNIVIFPDPEVEVNCDVIIQPEPCPVPAQFAFTGCQDSLVLDAGDYELESVGRIVQIDATIKNVCPGKRVALAVILTEENEEGEEFQRGLKTLTIPAHNSPSCRDILVKCVKFVLPEDLALTGEEQGSMCSGRHLKARFITHYIDTDYRCCGEVD